MPDHEAFGKRIHHLREAKKVTDPSFSLRQFAGQVGISPTYLSKVERGEMSPPSPEKIEVIAELLGVDRDELLALANRMAPELKDIITKKPEMASFLRTMNNIPAEELRKIMKDLEEKSKDSQPG